MTTVNTIDIVGLGAQLDHDCGHDHKAILNCIYAMLDVMTLDPDCEQSGIDYKAVSKARNKVYEALGNKD